MADVDITITDNSGRVKREMAQRKEKAIEILGLLAERYAKLLCTVDTGRLRNSITHATSSFPGVGEYEDNHGNRFSDATANKTPEKYVVYIGTNVEYAPYVELGTVRMSARAFLRPAIADHINEYKDIISKVMKGQL